MLCGWLGAFPDREGKAQAGKLLAIDEVGGILQGFRYDNQFEDQGLIFNTVPVNLKDRDAFHLTIEEYLHSLIDLIEELV